MMTNKACVRIARRRLPTESPVGASRRRVAVGDGSQPLTFRVIGIEFSYFKARVIIRRVRIVRRVF